VNRQVSGIDWRQHKDIRVLPQYTNMGSFVVNKSNVAAMIAASAS
jgi:hypothetical protein